MKRRLLALCSALLAVALLAACGGTSTTGGNVGTPVPSVSPSESPTASVPAPSPTESQEPSGILSAFTTTDLDGNDVTQDIFADYDVTMVNVWATFCSPCLKEMPDLGELHAEYADKSFQVVGLVADVMNQDGTLSDSQLDLAKDIVAETGAAYTHLLPSQDLYSLLSQATSVPTTLFVDKNGTQVGYAQIGALSKADWVKLIDEALAEAAE